jgi:hypothetical protein
VSAMVPSTKTEKTEEKSTNVGRFLAKRGVLLIKEFRELSAVRGEYGGRVSVSTLILSSAKATRGDVQYGIRLQHIDDEGDVLASGFLDYDEIAEVIGAFDFIHGVAEKMFGQVRDYTEVTYLTKDNLKFGFYQSEGQQQAFIDVGGYGQSLFISGSKLQNLKRSIEVAKEHLISRGADSENIET